MKCVSVMQPWASLILAGHKHYETRGWRTAYRGPLLIHASGRRIKTALELCNYEPFRTCLLAAGYRKIDDLPFGKVIGQVDLIDCKDAEAEAADINDWEKAFGDFSPGRWAWQLMNPHSFDGPTLRGKLGLFDVELEYAAASIG